MLYNACPHSGIDEASGTASGLKLSQETGAGCEPVWPSGKAEKDLGSKSLRLSLLLKMLLVTLPITVNENIKMAVITAYLKTESFWW